MTKQDELTNFVRLSQSVGQSAAYVQGGGGNTSVKFSDGIMAVKASGTTLKGLTEDAGYVLVNTAKVKQHLIDAKDEADFAEKLKQSTDNISVRPSMETGFHAALARYVVHTHSVYANVLNCSVEGHDMLHDLFPDAKWIPYCSPGRALSLAVSSTPDTTLFFLQNHGIIVCGPKADDVRDLHEAVNRKIRDRLSLIDDFSVEDEDIFNPAYMEDHILFPDQAIYTDPHNDLSDTDASKETLAAYAYIHRSAQKLGLTLRFLEKSDTAFLRNMDSEKYRMGITK